MITTTVHVAVFDTLADWEIGYATAHIRRDQPAVVDGDLITASGVAPVHFAQAIFGRLGLYEPGIAASWFKLYGDRDPAGFYELMSA